MGHYDQPSDQELIDELYHKSRSALEETARLRDQLAEAERAIAELRAEAEKWERSFVEGHAYYEQMKAERDEAKRVAVNTANRMCWIGTEYVYADRTRDGLAGLTQQFAHKGTEETIYAALRRAMGESE